MLTVVITGLGAGGLILFRQLRKGANSLAASEARAHYVATHDELTQLPNKALFLDRLVIAARRSEPPAIPASAVFEIGLDRYDEVVEVLGIGASDQVVVELAGRLNSVCAENDTIARLGDGVFGLLCSGADRDSRGGPGGPDHSNAYAHSTMRRPAKP